MYLMAQTWKTTVAIYTTYICILNLACLVLSISLSCHFLQHTCQFLFFKIPDHYYRNIIQTYLFTVNSYFQCQVARLKHSIVLVQYMVLGICFKEGQKALCFSRYSIQSISLLILGTVVEEVALTQVQGVALGFVECRWVDLAHLLSLSRSLQVASHHSSVCVCVDYTIQLGIICKLAEGTLDQSHCQSK